MDILQSVLLVLHMGVAVVLCGMVLLQHGKGADMGAAFGSGSSGSLFGASGSANFLSRMTAALATVFFLSSLGLTYLAATGAKPGDVMQQGVMGNLPADGKDGKDGKAGEVPKSAPAPAGDAAPAGSGSKAGEIPK